MSKYFFITLWCLIFSIKVVFSSNFNSHIFDSLYNRTVSINRNSEDDNYQSFYEKIAPQYFNVLPPKVIIQIATHLSLYEINSLRNTNKNFRKTIKHYNRVLNEHYLMVHYFDGQNNEVISQAFKKNLTLCINVYQSSHLFQHKPFQQWTSKFIHVRLGVLLALHCKPWEQLTLYFNYINFIKKKKFLNLVKVEKRLNNTSDHLNDLFNKNDEIKKLINIEENLDKLKQHIQDKNLTIFINTERKFYQSIIDKALAVLGQQDVQHKNLINPYWKYQLNYYRGKINEAANYLSTLNKYSNCDPEILYLGFKYGFSIDDKICQKPGDCLLELANVDFTNWKQNIFTKTLYVCANVQQDYKDMYINNSGNKIAKAQYYLAQLYHYGHHKSFSTPRNLIRAIDWYIDAANNGYAQAQLTLYNIYRNNILIKSKKSQIINVEQYYIRLLKAMHMTWLEAAASQGIAEAQYQYGLNCKSGEFIPQDHKLAKTWIKLSAEQGFTKAQYKLGVIYASNKDIPWHQNLLALKWFDQAAMQNHKDAQFKMKMAYDIKLAEQFDNDINIRSTAQYELGILYSQGDKLLEKDNSIAYRYLSSSAKLKNAMALYELGTWFEKGYYIEQNTDQAFALYDESSKLGFSGAICKVAKFYKDSQDRKQSLELYGSIKSQPNPLFRYYFGKASYKLSKMCKEDQINKNDSFGNEFHLYKAAVFGYTKAQYIFLKNCFSEHNNSTKYNSTILKNLYKSAENRNRKALFYLGQIYANGIGVEQNYQMAAKWYFKSAQQGYFKAQDCLQILYAKKLITQLNNIK